MGGMFVKIGFLTPARRGRGFSRELVMRNVAKALRPGGRFVFSADSLSNPLWAKKWVE